ncbi:MAG TPA: septum formation protein Maf [Flavobacteriales bacterium]|nr:septum formation protein Maf [Flavobacteriales bacterium]
MYKDYHIVLASKSPRRQELLKGLDIPFEVKEISVSEDYPDSINPLEVAAYLSEKKANAYDDLDNKKTIVITSDTIVLLDNKIFGKPQNKKEGFFMLKQLSGRTHQVITGVTLKSNSKQITFSETSSVLFGEHSDEVLMDYIEAFNPIDKAGAYGIQDCLDPDERSLGPLNITVMAGSYYNIIGLPVELLDEKLTSFIKELEATQ